MILYLKLSFFVVTSQVARSHTEMDKIYNGTLVTARPVHHLLYLDVLISDNFDELAELISSYPEITRDTHFVFVPGPLDIAVNSILPRRPLISTFVTRLKNRVPHVHFATNPCRIKFFHQEIVVFREDLMSRILRNTVGVKPDIKSEDLKKYVRHPVPGITHS